jgi:isopenicillin N synthase-like dioxygenase
MHLNFRTKLLSWCRTIPEPNRFSEAGLGLADELLEIESSSCACFCRGLLHEYTLSCKRVKDGILRAMARLLELDDDDRILDQFGDKGSTYARFNYYPACPRPDLVLGIRPHSDICVLTLLLMDEHVAGLQVLRDGTWYGVPAARNRALLINVGVSLEVARSHL